MTSTTPATTSSLAKDLFGNTAKHKEFIYSRLFPLWTDHLGYPQLLKMARYSLKLQLPKVSTAALNKALQLLQKRDENKEKIGVGSHRDDLMKLRRLIMAAKNDVIRASYDTLIQTYKPHLRPGTLYPVGREKKRR